MARRCSLLVCTAPNALSTEPTLPEAIACPKLVLSTLNRFSCPTFSSSVILASKPLTRTSSSVWRRAGCAYEVQTSRKSVNSMRAHLVRHMRCPFRHQSAVLGRASARPPAVPIVNSIPLAHCRESVNASFHGRGAQTDLVCSHWALPITSFARGGDPGAAPPAHRAAKKG